MTHGLGRLPGKRPIGGRYLLCLLWLGCATPSAGEPLGEGQAVQLGLARPGVEDVLAGTVALAESEAAAAAMHPNPVAAYGREQTFGGADASAEDYAWLLQKFDLSGRRGLRAEAAQRRVEARQDEVRGRRQALGAAIRLRFYEVLLGQQRCAALRQWSARLATAAERVGRRAAAGDAASYDRQRAEREHAAARARLAIDEAALARARARLAAVIGDGAAPADAPAVDGALLPAAPLPSLDATLAQVPSRPDLRALEASAAAADLQGRASARWWLPEIEIGAGYKGVDVGNERLDGFIANGAVPLPLFDRDQDEAQRAAAEARIARGQWQVELAEAAGELRGLHGQAATLTDAARAARSAGDRDWRALTRSAEAAYQGGETGILELVDAYRAELDAELQTLDLEWRARRARIELDRLTGAEVE